MIEDSARRARNPIPSRCSGELARGGAKPEIQNRVEVAHESQLFLRFDVLRC